jgi:hypothetical protein
MIIFGEEHLNWVSFKDLPFGCSFISRDLKDVHKKDYVRGFYGTQNNWVVPLADYKGFAQIETIVCGVAVRKVNESKNTSTSTIQPS